jgi:serine/threonine protein phosphatase PrpC
MNDTGYETAQATLIGDRDLNQDRCALVMQGRSLLLVLADGMGGHPNGEMAAQIAVDCFVRGFSEAPQPIPDPTLFLAEQVLQAHRQINAYGDQHEPPTEPRTTLVAALVEPARVTWTHLGDSRLYLLRHHRILAQTVDHSYVRGLVEQGTIGEQEIDSHPLRNYVTRCLGGAGEAPEPSLGSCDGLQPGDLLLLCSDGLWASLGNERLMQTLADRSVPLQQLLSKLAQSARSEAYPRSDNVTAVAVRCPASPATPAR